MGENLILKAARFAEAAHRGQHRKWGHSADPYIWHPMRVAGLVSMDSRATEEMVAAAWLHDVVEDTGLKLLDMKEAGFPTGVLSIVAWMTNQKTKEIRSVRKAAMAEKFRTAPWEAQLVKLADRLDNVLEMRNDPKTPAGFMELYKGESKMLLGALKGANEGMEERLGCLLE